MNLLVSCGVFHPHQGGAESLFGDLCERLAGDGHQVDVVTRHLESTADEETYRGARIRRFHYPVDYEALRRHEDFEERSEAILGGLRRIIEQRRIETVCVGLLDMGAMYLLRLRSQLRFRLVVYLHGGEVRVLQRHSPTFHRLMLHCLRQADAVVAVSQGLADDAEALYPAVRPRLHVIRNGIDVSLVRAAPLRRLPRPYALYAGRLALVKAVPRIIEAFGLVAAEEPAVDLLLAGTGDREHKAREVVDRLGLQQRVVFLGAQPRDEVFSLMRGARFLTLASDAEGLPIVALEALAAGTPVVAPRVPGVTELIEDGVNGLLFEPVDKQGYAERMLELFRSEDLHRRLRAGVERFPIDRYDLGRLWRQHLELFEAETTS